MGCGRELGERNPVGRWVQEARCGLERMVYGGREEERGESEGCFRKINYNPEIY